MTGIIIDPQIVRAVLVCDRRDCSDMWTSLTFSPAWDATSRIGPALDAGWRIYADRRRIYHTYCPDHAPTVPMRLVHGTEREDQDS